MLRIVKAMNELAAKGHTITIRSFNGTVVYDMETMAKSHLYIHAYPVNNKLKWEARYDKTGELDLEKCNNLEEEITRLVFDECMGSQQNASSAWYDRFAEYDLKR
jgi:hypothetical protein